MLRVLLVVGLVGPAGAQGVPEPAGDAVARARAALCEGKQDVDMMACWVWCTGQPASRDCLFALRFGGDVVWKVRRTPDLADQDIEALGRSWGLSAEEAGHLRDYLSGVMGLRLPVQRIPPEVLADPVKVAALQRARAREAAYSSEAAVQTDLAGARQAFEEYLRVMQQVLGPEHPDTLTAMYNLANVLWAQGEQAEARRLNEAVQPLLRKVLGPEHPSTLTAMSLLAEVLRAQGERAEARRRFEEVLPLLRKVLGDEHPTTLMTMNNLAAVLDDQGELAEARRLNGAVLALRRKVLGPEHPETFTTMGNLALVLRDQGELAEARRLFEAVLALRRKVLGPEHPYTLGTMNNLAGVLQAQGELAEARRRFEEVMPLLREVLGPEHPDTLLAMGNLAGVLQDQGELAEARRRFEEVLVLQRKVLRPEHPDTLTAMGNLASVLQDQGELAEARRLYEAVLVLRRKVLGPEHPDTLLTMGNLAVVLQAQGELAEARRLHEAVLALLRKVLGPEHPYTIGTMSNLALVLQAQGELAEARRRFEEVLPLLRKVLGPEHPDTLGTMNSLAMVLHAQGEPAEARRRLEEVLPLWRKVLGPEHPSTLLAMDNMALVLHAQGELAEARRRFEEVLPLLRKVLGDEHPTTLLAMSNLATVLMAQGELAEARWRLEEVLPLLRKVLGDEHPDTLTTMSNLALVLHAQGEPAEARRRLEEVLPLWRKVLGPEHPSTLLCEGKQGVDLMACWVRCTGQPASRDCLFALRFGGDVVLKVWRTPDQADQDFEALGRSWGLSVEEARHLRDYLSGVMGLRLPVQRIPPEVLADPEKAAALQRANARVAAYSSLAAVQADLAGARQAFEECLRVMQQVLGPEHPETLTAMNNLANVLWAQGEQAEARRRFEEVLLLWRKVLGPEHPATLTAMNNLASVLQAQGELAEARRRLEEVLPLLRKVLGDEHPDTLGAMNNLASVLQGQGELAEARRLYEAVLPLWRKVLGPEHPHTLAALNNLALVLQAQGELAEAQRRFEAVLPLWRKVLGDEHPGAIATMTNLAGVLARQGQRGRAALLAAEVLEAANASFLREGAWAHDEGQLWTYVDVRRGYFELALTLQLHGDGQAAWRSVLMWQGTQTRLEAQWRDLRRVERLVEASGDQGLVGAWQAWREAGAREASLALLPLGAGEVREGPGGRNAQLAEAREARAAAEDSLGQKSPEFRRRRTWRGASAEAVCERLRATKSALVTWVVHRPVDLASGKPKAAQLLAFVVTPEAEGCGVQVEALGPVDEPSADKPSVASLVAAWRQTIVATQACFKDYGLSCTSFDPDSRDPVRGPRVQHAAALALRRAVWDPVARHLPPGLETTWLVPDGDLVQVPFGALPSGEQPTRWLVEDHTFGYLVAPARLADAAEPLGPARAGLLAVAGVDYHEPAAAKAGGEQVLGWPDCSASACEAVQAAGPAPREAGLLANAGSCSFAAQASLPDATQALAAFSTRDAFKPVRWAGKTRAGERALTEALAATPGGFLPLDLLFITHGTGCDCRANPDRCENVRPTPAPRTGDDLGAWGREPLQPQRDDLRLVGLALSGANQRVGRPPEDDGWLTGREVVDRLDLTGVRLVLLAACETAIGTPVVGEGALALTRAFLVAGARTVVSSLWQVPVEAMHQLLAQYAEEVNQHENERIAALTQAQRRFIEAARREKALAIAPYFWGAFIAVGEPN